jgi:hypothetical protein
MELDLIGDMINFKQTSDTSDNKDSSGHRMTASCSKLKVVDPELLKELMHQDMDPSHRFQE